MRMSDAEFEKVQKLLLDSAKDNDEAHDLLLVPHGTPIVPAIQELISERNEARETLAQYELDLSKAVKEEIRRIRSAWSVQSFLSASVVTDWFDKWLAGDEQPGPAAQLRLKDGEPEPVEFEQLRALRDMITESVEGKDEKSWVREMLRKGFVPSIANVKARRERDEAQSEAQQWHDLVSRLRTYLDIPDKATHEDAPRLAREALTKAEVRGAQWMSEAVVLGARDTAEKVCAKRRDPNW